MSSEEILQGHWRKQVDTNWAGAWCLTGLPNQSAIVRIAKVSKLIGVKVQGNMKDVIAVTFEPNDYVKVPMILNATNAKAISAVKRQLSKVGSPEYKNASNVESWIGLRITLQVMIGKAFGEDGVEMLRVSKTPPPQTDEPKKKEVMGIDHPKFAAAREAVKAGTCSIDYVTQNYDVNEQAMAELKAVLPKGGTK